MLAYVLSLAGYKTKQLLVRIWI